MKIAGVDPSTLPAVETLVFPRDGQFIVFTARGLPDLDEFEALCPLPTPPAKMTPKGITPDLDDKGYLSVMDEWNKRRISYFIVKSLEPSEIEWDTVKMDQPNTWANWSIDLKNGGFSKAECNLVFNLCFSANSLDEDKLKAARESFRHGQQGA